jgi:hypothetical protein
VTVKSALLCVAKPCTSEGTDVLKENIASIVKARLFFSRTLRVWWWMWYVPAKRRVLSQL